MSLGTHQVTYVIVTFSDTLENKVLPPGTRTQLAELIALTRVLEFSQSKRVTVLAHTFFLMPTPLSPCHQETITISPMFQSKKVAVVHYRGHQKGTYEVSEAHRWGGNAIKKVAN